MELYGHIILRIKKVLKAIRPRKLTGNIVYGGKTPDTTGYALGIYSVLASIWRIDRRKFSFAPNFEDEELTGDIYIKGHITIAVILFNAACVYFDKRLKLFLKRIKRHQARNEQTAGGNAA